jgi:hypothetical protein
MKIATSLVVALTCAACGSKANTAATITPATAAPTSSNSPATSNLNLTFGEFQLLDENKTGLAIHSNGAVNMVGVAGDAAMAAIAPDGKVKTSDGKDASLGADGNFTGPDGRLWFNLDGETLNVAGKHISIDANGNLVGASEGGGNLHVVGAKTVGEKRVVLMVLGLMISAQD